MKVVVLLLQVLVASVSALPHLEPAADIAELPEPAGNATQELAKRTGQGGYLNLINGGPYTWTQTYKHSYQMNGFDFPQTIGPYSMQRVYIEFDTGAGKNRGDDSGEVTYNLAGTGMNFQVQATGRPSFNLQVKLLSLSTQNNAQGSTISLGWVHDNHVSWVLSGQEGQFTSSRPPANWMQTNLGQIGKLPLQRLSIPGSHDAGMSRITGGTAFGNACNSVTQTVGIDGQLAAGSRYFDIRPIITGGGFSTGHYTGDAAVLNTFQGANGQPIGEIVNQLNAFTANNKELIIINLSHSLNTDVGTSDYRKFNQDEWNRLLNQLMGINNLFDASRLPGGFSASSGDLSTLALNQFIGDRAAVVLIVEDSADLGGWFGRGVFSYGQYDVFNSYSDTDNLTKMRDDQLDKLVNQHHKVFLLSWTLTLTGVESALCTKSIIDFANQANPALYNTLMNAVSPTRNIVPNILYVDNMSNSDIIGVAMAYNFWQSTH